MEWICTGKRKRTTEKRSKILKSTGLRSGEETDDNVEKENHQSYRQPYMMGRTREKEEEVGPFKNITLVLPTEELNGYISSVYMVEVSKTCDILTGTLYKYRDKVVLTFSD